MDIATLGLNVDSRQAATAVKVLDDLTAAGGRAEKSTDKLTTATTGAGSAQRQTKRDTEALTDAQNKNARAADGMAAGLGTMRNALGALGLAVTVRELVSMADAQTNVASRLALVTNGTVALAAAQRDLFQIAQQSRVSYTDLAGTYAQMARSTKALGISQTEMLGVTRTISQALTVSGASAASSNAALVQLSQGFASGTLRGEELNSVMEQTPRLAQAIADGLGVSVGRLREMGQAGELTAAKVVAALQASAASVEKEFGRMAVTVEQSMTVAANSVGRLVGTLNEMTGATSLTAAGIIRISTGVDELNSGLQTLRKTTGGDFWFAFFNNERSVTGELQIARKELAGLEDQFKKFPNSIYVRADVAEARARVAELEADLRRVRNLANAGNPATAVENAGVIAQGRAREAWNARQAKLQDDRDALLRKSSGVSESYVKDMAEGIRLNKEGVLVGEAWNKFLSEQQAALLKKTGVTKDANAADRAANKELEEQQKLIAELGGLTGSFAEDWARLTAIYSDSKGAVKDVAALTEAQAALLAKQPAIKAAHDATAKAADAEHKASAALAEVRLKEFAAQESGVEKLIESNEQSRLEIELIGLTVEQQRAMLRTREEITIATKESTLAEMQRASAISGTATRAEIALEQEIALLRERNNLQGQRNSRDDAVKRVEAEAKANADMLESLDRTAHDVFVNVAENGMGAFERIGKTLKSAVLDMLYQMTVRKWILNIGASVFGGTAGTVASAASGAGGIGNIASMAGGLLNLGSTAAGWLGSGVGAIFGQTAGNAALAASLGLGSGSAAAAASGAALAGGGSAAGAGLGAAIPGMLPLVGAGILALTSLLKATKGETRTGGQFGVAFDGSVTNQRRGQTYTYQGQQFDRDFSGGARTALTSGQAYRLEGDPVAQESAIRGAVAGTAAGINAMLSALGSAAQLTGFSAGFETSGKGRGGAFSGGRLNTGALFGESGKGDNYAGTLYETTSTTSPDFQTALANFTLDLKQSTIQALQAATDIPRTIRDALANVDAEALTDQTADALITSIGAQIEGVRNLKAAFDAMGMAHFAKLGFDAAAAMAEVSGGFDVLSTRLSSYYQKYYSDQERATILTGQLTKQFAALGFELPRSRTEFRALIDANEALGEGGAKTVAQLLGLADAFYEISEAAGSVDAAYSALERAVKSENDALKAQRDALNQRRSIHADLLGEITDIFDLLGESIHDLRGEVVGGAAALAGRGRTAIDSAIATGTLPGRDELATAIGDVRTTLDDNNFATRFEADKSRLQFTNDLGRLQAIAGEQKTFEELQLSALDEQIAGIEKQIKQNEEILSYWKLQIDLTNGSINATLSVAAAVAALAAQLKPATPSDPGTSPGGAFAGVGGGGGGGGGMGGPVVDADAMLKARIDQQLAFAAEQGRGHTDAATLQAINAALYGSGATNADIARIYGISEADVAAMFAGAGIPRYQQGTNYVPEDGLAYLHRGEAVVPAEINAAGGDTAMGGTVQELLSKIEANTRATAIRAHSINQVLQRVAPNGDAIQVEVVTP